MSPHSTATKPAKPWSDFPLFPHATGRWAKKIRGKLHYFGPWDAPLDALDKYQRQRDDLHAGRKPRPEVDGIEVRDVANTFLDAKRRSVEAGELRESTFDSYHRVMATMVEQFGRRTVAESLRPDDFADLRATIAKRYGPTELARQIQVIRSAFKHAYDAELIDKPIRFGPEFKRPQRRAMRKVRAERPRRFFEAEDLRKLIDGARVPHRAMILLGINCGWGQTDVANLEDRHLDLQSGFADFPRPKTLIERQAVLWPETVDAIHDSLRQRPMPRDEEDVDLVFVTRKGRRFVRYQQREDGRGTWIDGVNLAFNKLQNKIEIKRQGVGFYALRHTFQTIAEGAGDRAAVERIMGHENAGEMANAYRERMERARLQAVADHVHAWLWGAS